MNLYSHVTLRWTAGEMQVCPCTAQLYLPASSLLTDCSRSWLFPSLLSVNGCEFLYQMNVSLSVRAQLLLHVRRTESPSFTLSGDSTWRSEHNTHIISSAAVIHWLLFNIMHRRRVKVTCDCKSYSWSSNPFAIIFISDESEIVLVFIFLCHMTQSDRTVLLFISQILNPLTVFRVFRQICKPFMFLFTWIFIFTFNKCFGPEHFLDLMSSRVCISAAHYHWWVF